MLLHESLKNYRLLLASHSPRRRELLSGCGIDFTLVDTDCVEETFPPQLPPQDVPLYLARLKSHAYAAPLAPNDILVTADTVVIAAGKVLGKPSSRDNAIAMLRMLSGAEHKVITGVTLRTRDIERSFSCESRVWFRRLREEQITYYVDRFAPMDKAGAYGIQEWIGYVGIEHIEGSFYNIMGLPVQRLYAELENLIETMSAR